MTRKILQQLAGLFGGKLSRCRIYDANVCSFQPLSDKPWVLTPVSGKPFSGKLQFASKGRSVILLDNGEITCGRVKGTFSSRPFSINTKLKSGFSSEHAGRIAAG